MSTTSPTPQHDAPSTTNIPHMSNSHAASPDGHGGRRHTKRDANPQVVALFLVRFDKKIGYTISWHRTASSLTVPLDLDGIEYKALPSGLHAVKKDLVYFTHRDAGGDEYVGLSAFAAGEAGAEDRGARFVSVGVLVRREGVLGRAWVLAKGLERVAWRLVRGGDEEEEEEEGVLEGFWEEVMGGEEEEEEEEERLAEHHPARSVVRYVDVCGPLVFRLQQAALLRKRVLFVGGPPVRDVCEFVYNLTVLSSISLRDAASFLPGTDSLLRIPSLFSIGVHDIPLLEKHYVKHGGHTGGEGDSPIEGWVACTTDEIIATKKHLYDIVVEFDNDGRWPKVRTSEGNAVRASQRDLARWKMLRKELRRHVLQSTYTQHYTDDEDGDEDAAPLLHANNKEAGKDEIENLDDAAIEPTTWSRLAYLGFMWWASAGEKDAYTTAERDMDRDLIAGMSPCYSLSPSRFDGNVDSGGKSKGLETDVIAYFHRLTSVLVKTLEEVIQDEEIKTNNAGNAKVGQDDILIAREDVQRMGLDAWSEADGAFIGEFSELYFGRGVRVGGNEIECCGVRIGV